MVRGASDETAEISGFGSVTGFGHIIFSKA
jgi:hypothetical protein